MTIDKEILLQHFLANYLPQEAVHARLPLSVPFSNFWEELQTKRKAGSVILPLYNAAGEPYWYHLSDTAMDVSNRICEEMMRITNPVNLFQPEMTTSMTEEMFYTSYVEGAPVEFDSAIDFLCSGCAPSDVNELMLYNNRVAWETMVSRLFLPMNEENIRLFALTLTAGMEAEAEDYRSSDTHMIASMGGESYILPTAESVPKRMNDLYQYLADPSVHPLIKATIAHAYILAVRPFDEGNERLARMVSTGILLRSGYDFLRDISISSVIAQETYAYYNATKEIHRGNNNGDLTFFMDYFFGLLDRVLDAKEKQSHRKIEEAPETASQGNDLPKQQELSITTIQSNECCQTSLSFRGLVPDLGEILTANDYDTNTELITAANESDTSNDGESAPVGLIFGFYDDFLGIPPANKLYHYLRTKFEDRQHLFPSASMSWNSSMKLLTLMLLAGRKEYSAIACSDLFTMGQNNASGILHILYKCDILDQTDPGTMPYLYGIRPDDELFNFAEKCKGEGFPVKELTPPVPKETVFLDSKLMSEPSVTVTMPSLKIYALKDIHSLLQVYELTGNQFTVADYAQCSQICDHSSGRKLIDFFRAGILTRTRGKIGGARCYFYSINSQTFDKLKAFAEQNELPWEKTGTSFLVPVSDAM